MKRILTSIPFLFIFGLLIWTVNSIVASMFTQGQLAVDSSLFSQMTSNLYFRLLIMFFSVFLYMILFRIFLYENDEKLLRKAFNHSFPVCMTDFKGNIVEANDSYMDIFKTTDLKGKKIKCSESRPNKACHTEQCPLTQINNGKDNITCEHAIKSKGETRYYDVKVKSMNNSFDEVVGIIETFYDVTDRVTLLKHNQKLVADLKESLHHIKLLSGMLPVCTSCKQVRSDEGYWEQIESYLGENSEIEVVSSLCPCCKEASDSIEDLCDEQNDYTITSTDDMKWLKIAS